MFTDFMDSFRLEPGIWEICLRLLCAMMIGMVIGTEREYTNRPAGMRTHILVALGACVVALTGQMLMHQYGHSDPARMAAQVIAGVGFLGAGTIMREGATVKGLTTAASVWTVACLGITAGYGYYAIALVGMVFMLLTLTVLELLQHHLPGRKATHEDYTVQSSDLNSALTLINDHATLQRAHIRHILAEKLADGRHKITFQAEFYGVYAKKRQERFFAGLVSTDLDSVQRDVEFSKI